MLSSRLRLHHRVVLPVVLVALVTTALAAFLSQSLVKRALEARVRAQLVTASAAVSRNDFAINQSILDRVKDIAGVDVLTYTLSGEIIASTVPAETGSALTATVLADRTIASAAEGDIVTRSTTCGQTPCYIAYRRVVATGDTVIALVEQTSELAAATQAMTRTILLSAALGLLLLVFVGQVAARRVTEPLDRLVAFTNDVSSGSAGRRASVTDDEVGRLARAFNDMLDRLDLAQEAVVRSEKLALAGVMAARVAHDIRNPLSSLRMRAQLLRSRVQPGDGPAMLQAILHDVDEVESVVRGLLELAKPGLVHLQPTQVNDVIRRVLEQQSPQLAHLKITVSTDLDAALPSVPLDADRFNQALRNVLSNAAEAMPSGGAISISTGLDDTHTSVLLRICDDGVGVDPAMLDRVFDPFVSSKREGVGLGLVNTKSIVESHGGRVQLAARAPHGTCVTIWLPLGGPAAALLRESDG